MRSAAALALLSALAFAVDTGARPPAQGTVVTGRSLGGIALGATPADVGQAWGASFGRCRDCAQTTWYFNYRPFRPEGVGVQFRAGRVVAVFTLWSPRGWRTARGLRIGDHAARATTLHGGLIPVECGTYRALTIQQPDAVTAVYVVDDRVWGFALSRPGVPICR